MKQEQIVIDDLDVGNCEDCQIEINSNFKRCYSCHQKSLGKNNFKHIESEGEEFIANFLDELGITYFKQVEIHNLKNDKKHFRVADFKLKKFNMYIEYDGNFHNNRERYAEKKQVYNTNNIVCIYLYPENLGALPFFFDKRIETTLKKYNRFSDLKKYRWFKYYKGEAHRLTYLFFIFVLSTFTLLYPEDKAPAFTAFLIIAGLYQIYKLISAYRKVFLKECYPLKINE